MLALALLLALPLAPSVLALPAGLAFAAAQGWMGTLLLLTLLRYRKELLPVLLARKLSPK